MCYVFVASWEALYTFLLKIYYKKEPLIYGYSSWAATYLSWSEHLVTYSLYSSFLWEVTAFLRLKLFEQIVALQRRDYCINYGLYRYEFIMVLTHHPYCKNDGLEEFRKLILVLVDFKQKGCTINLDRGCLACLLVRATFVETFYCPGFLTKEQPRRVSWLTCF